MHQKKAPVTRWQRGRQRRRRGGAVQVLGRRLPGPHGVPGGLRRGRRRRHLQHGGVPGCGFAPQPVRLRRRRDALRPRRSVAHRALQPHQLLHPLPPPRCRHPGHPGNLNLPAHSSTSS
ncbi:hypothetical protein BHE74_00034719 [Ensete ventricosum]|nr:hypothetical protein BHE74_00034719 [Ensete ventricosum]